MEVFFYFLSCVWAVLCLVLFFKIWGMCNDVGKIKSQLDRNDDFSSKIEFLLRIGEKEKAREILIAKILSDEFIFNTTSTPVEKMEALSNKYQEEFSRLGITLTQEEDEK